MGLTSSCGVTVCGTLSGWTSFGPAIFRRPGAASLDGGDHGRDHALALRGLRRGVQEDMDKGAVSLEDEIRTNPAS